MKYVSHKSSTENQKTHVTFNNVSESHAVYEIMWKNMAELIRTQMTIRRMRTSRWEPKTTNTLRICNTYCFSTGTTVHESASMLCLCLHCLSCHYLQMFHHIWPQMLDAPSIVFHPRGLSNANNIFSILYKKLSQQV